MTLIAERNPRVNAIWWTFLACLLVVITAIHNPATRLWVTHDPTVVGAIAAVALIGGCFRGWRIGLRIDQSGMTIRNYFRTHRIGWPEVSLFADGSALGLFAGGQSPGGDFGWGWALRVVLADGRQTASGGPGSSPGRRSRGRPVTARGTLAGLPPRPETLTAIRQAAELYGIPAELTGVPRRPALPGSPGTLFAVCLAGTVAALAAMVVLYARDLSKPHADFSLAALALGTSACALTATHLAWQRLKRSRADRSGE